MVACNICGGSEFVRGPNERLAQSGASPRCGTCYSLERHRSLRECLNRLPPEMLSGRRAIQFAPDPSIDPDWFHSYENSQFGGENSIDLQEINRPANSYDFISLSSVLEMVPDDQRAFRELARIGSSNCIIHCTFVPVARATRHYDMPHGAFNRYHLYGLDVSEWFDSDSHDLTTVMAIAVDPVTGVKVPTHFFC